MQQRRIESDQKSKGNADGVEDVWHAFSAATTSRKSQGTGEETPAKPIRANSARMAPS